MSEARPAGAGWKRWLRLAGSLATASLFIWLLARQNWTQVLQDLGRVPVYVFVGVFALFISGQLANSLRWFILLKAQRLPATWPETARIIFSGAFASNFLPSTIGGDAYRILALFRYTENRALCVGSVVLDRFLNVLAMLSFLPFSWAAFGSPLELLKRPRASLGVAAAALGWGERLGAWLRRLGRKFFAGLEEALRLWASQPLLLGAAFVVSWISIFVVMLGVWLLARALGIPVALYQVMGISCLTYLVILLPISINGYGLREVTVTFLYVQVGATLEQAAALALITRLISVLETLPGAFWLPRIFSTGKDVPNEG